MSLRERINGDPKLQIGLGAVLLLVVVFFLMNKGGGEEGEAVEEPTAVSVESAAEPAVGVEGAEGESSLASLAAGVNSSSLPHKVIAAYDADKTVVVLFVHDGGVDDQFVKRSSRLIEQNVASASKLFVVPVKQVHRYTALTLGMQMQRVPAIVILRRKSLSKAGPEASILYGYQASSRIRLAVRNASYKGPKGSYHPG